MGSADEFISSIYRATKRVNIEHYRSWALEKLREFLDVDAAVWSTGHLSTRTFHTHTTLNLPTNFPDLLIDNIKINPITAKLFTEAGKPVDMSEVIADKEFFESEIYYKVFQPHKIERILSSVHIDSRSGIYTLLSVYRFDHERSFTDEEKQSYQRILFHLIEAASHACILSLEDSPRKLESNTYYAICDRHGIYHEAEPKFLDIIESNLTIETSQHFPLSVPLSHGNNSIGKYIFSSESLGDLYRIKVREVSKLDALTDREFEVVKGVTSGLSFKLIAKQLGLSPSTVSNHLYRVYHKLEINSRAELAELVNLATNK